MVRGGMASVWIGVLVLLAAACRGEGGGESPGGGAEPPTFPAPPALPDPGPLAAKATDMTGGPVVLRSAVADREELSVRLEQTASTRQPGRAPLEHRLRQSFTLVRQVVSRTDTSMRMTVGLRDVRIEPLGPDGKPVAPPAAMAGFAPALERVEVDLTLDSRGEITALEVTGSTHLPEGMEELFRQLVRDLRVGLPEGPVSPGDRWTDEGSLPVQREKTRNVVRWRLEGSFRGTVEGPEGLRCVLVDAAGEIEEEGRVEHQGMTGQVEGRGQVRRLALLDPTSGRLVELRMVSALSRRLTLGAGPEAAARARVEELTMSLDVTRRDDGEEE